MSAQPATGLVAAHGSSVLMQTLQDSTTCGTNKCCRSACQHKPQWGQPQQGELLQHLSTAISAMRLLALCRCGSRKLL
jgi:hypothetical protein